MSRDITAQFQRDISTHKMTIVRDDGVSRHLRFSRPNSSCMHFDLITWPGYLCYTGDMGTYVFQRLTDMFQFFRRGDDKYSIDMGYWAEKVEASDRDGVREFSYTKYKAMIRDWINELEDEEKPHQDDEPDEFAMHAAAFAELRREVESEVVNVDENSTRCYDAASDFRHDGEAWIEYKGEPFEFRDVWDGFDYATREFTHRFMWCCYALAWSIDQYDMAKAEQVPA